ncbi:MAG: hypothetical protein ABFD16_19505 [Thermoguttaceae bacterium]|jgi:hypothetical protein
MMEPNKKPDGPRPTSSAARILRFDPPHSRVPKPLVRPWGKGRPKSP